MLQQILQHKRQEISAREAVVALAELKAQALDAPPTRNFTAAVTRRRGETGTRDPLKAIAEIKRASPSAGLIRPSLDVAAVAASYRAAGASAISVLTDSRFFKGSLDDIAAVRGAVDLPILRKEFIVAPYQIYESRVYGADAILLIVAALDASQLADFAALARSLSLHPLVEVHTLAELETAKQTAGVSLIGINNRDLATLQTRLDTTFALLPHLPPDAVVVSESGISRAEEVQRLAEAGVDAILVGESLLKSSDPGNQLRELLTGAHG
jgi:indole-3-glycerol phosphate synthase